MELWTDKNVWLIAGWGMAVCAPVLLWFQTGRSPLIWLAWLALAAEAWRVETLHALAVAIRTFSTNYRPTFARLQREALIPAPEGECD